jgi:ABC-type glycerol-3-phosphate transport system substrate-binding protein
MILAGCGADPQEKYEMKLEIWGTFDDSDAYQDIFSEYRKINPHITQINYRKLPTESYEQDLLEALAAGNGPDIFMVRNSWMGDFQDKMVPAPPAMIPEKNYRDNFPDVAAGDFISSKGEIYGIPISVDSLALYYNKDIFNAYGIARAPVTWEEVEQLVPRLTQIDSFGNITQAGIAMGTAQNINRSTDILMTLLYQKGSKVTSGKGAFEMTDTKSQEAMQFYKQFADIRSPLYTWNQNQHYSIDAFYEGNLAMMLNYSWQYPALKQKNAKLNIGVAPLPQFAEGVKANQANYWGYGVAANKTYVPDPNNTKAPSAGNFDKIRQHESWQFLKYFAFAKPQQSLNFQNALTGDSQDLVMTVDPSKMYLEKTNKPAARRDLIAQQQTDVVLGPFASGNLIARNLLYKNVDAIEGVLAELITTVYNGGASISDALNVSSRRIETLLR